MGGALSNYLFELYWNNPKRIHVFYKENDLTNFLREERKDRMRNKNSMNLCVWGVMGSGKSYGVHTLAQEHQDDFRLLYKKRELFEIALFELDKLANPINIHLTWEDSMFLEKLSTMFYGDLVIRDESPRGSSTDSKTISDAIKNIIEEVRGNQNSFILVTPNKKVAKALSEEGIIHFFFQTAGLEIIEDGESRIRFIVRDESFKPVGRIIIPIDFDNELSKSLDYDTLKDDNIKMMIGTRGMANAEVYGEDRALMDSERLLKFCYEKGYLKRRDIELLAFEEYNRTAKNEKRLNEIIAGSWNNKQKIIQKVYKAISKGKYSLFDDEIDPKNTEETVETGFISHLVKYYDAKLKGSMYINQKTQISKENIIKILKSIGYGRGQRDISNDIKGIHLGLVQDVSTLFRDGKRSGVSVKDDFRLYRCYEEWVSKLINFDLISGKGKIDLGKFIYNDLYPAEVKLFNEQTNSKGMDKNKFHTYKELKHIQKAKKEKKKYSSIIKDDLEYFPVFARNFKKGDVDYIFKVSIKGDLRFNFEFKEENIFSKCYPGGFDPEEFFKIKKVKK